VSPEKQQPPDSKVKGEEKGTGTMQGYVDYFWLDIPNRSPQGEYFLVPWTIPGFSFAKGESGTMNEEGNIKVELLIGDGLQGDQRIELGSSLLFNKEKKLQKIIPPS